MSDTGALYEPLIERELDAIPAAARAFASQHSEEELWIAVTRFAVLAYVPSQHAKRAVMACRAAYEVREELGQRWLAMIIECARYAAESRQPWSEPPILDLPHIEDAQPRDAEELRAAIAAHDRLRAERWLAARIADPYEDLRSLAAGDARLMLDTVMALEKLLGEKGRYALLRIVIAELLASSEDEGEPLEASIDRAIEDGGSIASVQRVFIGAALLPARAQHAAPPLALEPYALARDYAQTLIAHAIARKLPARAGEFLAAVHHNLEHGESFAAWSLA